MVKPHTRLSVPPWLPIRKLSQGQIPREQLGIDLGDVAVLAALKVLHVDNKDPMGFEHGGQKRVGEPIRHH